MRGARRPRLGGSFGLLPVHAGAPRPWHRRVRAARRRNRGPRAFVCRRDRRAVRRRAAVQRSRAAMRDGVQLGRVHGPMSGIGARVPALLPADHGVVPQRGPLPARLGRVRLLHRRTAGVRRAAWHRTARVRSFVRRADRRIRRVYGGKRRARVLPRQLASVRPDPVATNRARRAARHRAGWPRPARHRRARLPW